MINLLKQEDRVSAIEELKKPFNIDRKSQALYRSSIQKDNIKPYVLDELKKQLYVETVEEMPIVSTVNVQKRVVRKKACVYTEGVTRTFSNLSDDKAEKVLAVYADGNANVELNKCNKKLVYEHQTILGILPRGGKLNFKKYELHQVDAFSDNLDPEIPDFYILSVFDREDVESTDAEIQNTATGHVPNKDKFQGDKPPSEAEIASKESYKRSLEKYIVWSKHYHFMMDGNGQVIDLETGRAKEEVAEQDLISPLAEYNLSPFIDISREKDGSFWNEQGSSLSDFTVQFNLMLSDLANNMKLNGYAVGVLKGPSELQPESQVIGASMLLKLPTDDPDKEVDFSFASPSSNIGEISESIDKILNYFITTEDLDSSVINSSGTSVQYQSGWDRFLALTEKRESTKEDYQLFKQAEENEIWAVVKAWLNVLGGTDTLLPKYQVGGITEDVEMEITYEQSEAILTEKEKIENVKARNELSLESRVTMLMKLDGITEEEAIEEIQRVDRTKELDLPPVPEVDTEEDEEEE